MKFIKSNIGFIVFMAILAAILFSPQVKGLVLQGLLKTGLYNPKINLPSQADAGDTRKAPPVTFRSSTGENIDISAAEGKVLFLNFWATWCPPCIAEMPSIQALKNKFNGKDVAFVMVDADNNLQSSEAFMKKHKYDLQVFSQRSSIPEGLFKGTLPTTVIISKSGEIVFYHEGMADYNSTAMEKLMNDLLK